MNDTHECILYIGCESGHYRMNYEVMATQCERSDVQILVLEWIYGW